MREIVDVISDESVYASLKRMRCRVEEQKSLPRGMVVICLYWRPRDARSMQGCLNERAIDIYCAYLRCNLIRMDDENADFKCRSAKMRPRMKLDMLESSQSLHSLAPEILEYT
jgi:hypothetical protein